MLGRSFYGRDFVSLVARATERLFNATNRPGADSGGLCGGPSSVASGYIENLERDPEIVYFKRVGERRLIPGCTRAAGSSRASCPGRRL